MNPDPRSLARGLALYQQARDLRQRGQIAPAADAFRQALALVPNHPGILADYGQLAEDVQDWKAAEQLYRRLRQVKDIANLDGKLGQALFHLDRYEDAIPLLEAFTRRNPGQAGVLRLLAASLFRLMRFDEAMAVARESWQAEQHPDAIALQIAVLIELGLPEPTGALVDEALARFPQDPQVRKLAAEHLLKARDYARGFALFADMCFVPGQQRHALAASPVPAWDGTRVDGTLLVGAEQGVGDEIQLSSVYADIAALGQRAVIEADARLLAVFRRSFPALEFVDRRPGTVAGLAATTPGCRKAIGGDLFGLFRRRAEDFPDRPAWLVPDPERTAQAAARYDRLWPGTFRVGISWRSQRVMRSGARKDVDLPAFRPLLAVDGARFVNLQYGDVGADLATLGADAGRIHVDPEVDAYNDIDGLFAQVAALDLVITTSNVTAHVAGALGKPCWLVLPQRRPVIWYWGYAGDRSDWYPAIRIFRNDRADDWGGLFAALADRLATAVAARGAARIG